MDFMAAFICLLLICIIYCRIIGVFSFNGMRGKVGSGAMISDYIEL